MSDIIRSDKLSQFDVMDAKSSYEQLARMSNNIEHRLDYVVRYILSAFGHQIDAWWFMNANEGEIGSIWEHVSSRNGAYIITDIQLELRNYFGVKPFSFKDKHGHTYGVKGSGSLTIPFRYLFEDFENELV